ncbi:hypothetical protein [Kitasatospora indigofera]|uniref:hypothetical protein n=1 Tax=Kitasatospora indigofera TaxID=67307 RepID=UPI003695183C
MSEESEDALRHRAKRLRRARTEAAEQEDAWLVALFSVDLEDVERLGRSCGIDLAEQAEGGR